MFHHFHNDKHKKAQGSLSGNILKKIIKKFGKKNILDANEFYEKLRDNKLETNHICLTFDDGIKSQYDVAFPILKKFKIKAFFFIYSSILTDKPDNLEIYRFFRCNFFENINDFYKLFFNEVKIDLTRYFRKKKKDIIRMKKTFPYYSINDIKYRILRDEFLSKKNLDIIMKKIFIKKNFKPEKYFNKIFMSKKDIKDLINDGHVIGLHSHSHPTTLNKLTKREQETEFKKNKFYLNKYTKNIYSMSHPCGSYSESTLKLLKKIGIKIGFKQHLLIEKDLGMKKINNSNLEIARRDSSEFLKMF